MTGPSPIDDQADLDPTRERTSEALRDFYLRSHRLIDRIMTEQGASFARSRLLMHIAQHGPLRSIDLASSFGYAPRTITEAIDGLERDGLVRRTPDPEDRRAKRIVLTPAGEAAAETAEASRIRYIEAVFGALSPDECGAMVDLVGKLNERLGTLGG
jgi:DNA-binding MarR family transcriptional regulator